MVNGIPESEKFWLWNLESWALESGFPLTIEMRSPSYPKIESKIQYLKFGISQNSTLRKRKGQERLREVRKFWKNRKSKKNFSCYVKRLSNKYGKNSKNNKFHKILHLEREKVKKGFEMSANFAKIAKLTRIFLPMWKDWATNMAKITRTTNFTTFYTWKQKTSRRASVSPQISQKSQK